MAEDLLKFKLYEPKGHHPDWKSLLQEAGELAAAIAENIPTRKFLQGTLLEKRKIKAITRTLKNFRRNRGKMRRGNHNFTPLFYIWTMTNQCNFDCVYCSDHRGNIYPELYRQGHKESLTTPEGKKMMEIMQEAGAVYFCGGEPTLRKDLPELLDHSTRLHMFNMINTNGSLLGDLLLKPRYRLFLLQMDVIIVSLDSLDIEKLSAIYRVNHKVARKTLRNILALRLLQKQVPFKLVANTVITADNIEDTFATLNWCNDLGITFSPVSANLGSRPDGKLLSTTGYRKLVSLILERAGQGYPMIASPPALERLLKATGFSCYPAVFDHIDVDGRLFWPCKAYQKAAKIDVPAYRNIAELRHAAAEMIDPTHFHGDGPEQCRGQCAWMQNCVTDMYVRGLKEGLWGSGLIKEIRGLLNHGWSG